MLSINTYEQPELILAFQRETPMPWTHAWIPESERAAFEAAFDVPGIPLLLLVGPDGRILDSGPTLQAEGLEARVRHFQAKL